jgi:flagellar protein FliJ
MKFREQALRTKRFEADEKKRKVEDLDMMIRDFDTMAADLERQIEAEENRTGIRDRAHFSYSTFAKAAALRRDNLIASVADLMAKRERAIADRDAAVADLQRAVAEVRDQPDRSHGRVVAMGLAAR